MRGGVGNDSGARLSRGLCGSVVALLLTGSALAEPVPFAEGTGRVDVFGAPVGVDWHLTAERHPEVHGALRIVGVADIAPVLKAVEAGLVPELERQSDGCARRVKARDPKVEINNKGHLLLAATLRFEWWLCQKLLGREVKTRLARETGRVQVEIAAEVVGGQIQLQLVGVAIGGLNDLSRLANADRAVRRDIEAAVDGFNADLRATGLPKDVALEGFAYEAAGLSPRPGEGLTATIAGPDRAMAILRVIRALAAR